MLGDITNDKNTFSTIAIIKQKLLNMESSMVILNKELVVCTKEIENTTNKYNNITKYYKEKKESKTVSGTGIKAVRHLR